MDESEIADRYSASLLQTQLWCEKARDLLRAAEALERNIETFWELVTNKQPIGGRFGDVHAPYFMLVAFAMENLCKAVLIQRNRRLLASQPTRMPQFLKTHDLRNLFKLLNIKASVEVEDLLIRLTKCSLWFGRYPVPINAAEFGGNADFSDGVRRLTAMFLKEDVPNLKFLIVQLQAYVDKCLSETDK